MLAWGRNESGQLGVADTEPRLSPMQVLSSSKFVSVACGSRTSLAVTNSGTILGFGSSVAKVMGEDVEDDAVTVPRAIEGLQRISQVATRGSHAVALDEEGKVYTWGRGEQNYQHITKPILLPLRAGVRVRLVSAGRMHSAAVDESGALFTWGSSDEGQTGLGRSSYVVIPTVVTNLPGPVTRLSCGSRHTLIVVSSASNGGVFGFGGNSYAQLGLKDREPRFEPCRIDYNGRGESSHEEELFHSSTAGEDGEIDVACGYRHSFIYTSKAVWGFGWNSNHQCSSSSEAVVSKPALVSFEGIQLTDTDGYVIKQVAGGGRHTLVLLKQRDQSLFYLVAFGRASSGELGVPRFVVEDFSKEPILVLTLSHTTNADTPKIACGWEHSVLTLAGGRVNSPSFNYSWFSTIKGDIDAALAQLVNCMVLLRLVPLSARSGVGATVAMSNFLFGAWAFRNGATALPHGLNTIAFFAIQMGVYDVLINRHPDKPEIALGGCYFCTITIGLLQAISSFAVAPLLKRYVPRSALAASVAGVALAFITTRFTGEIFDSARSGMSSLLILLIGFGARERMPFGIPVAFMALFVGWLVASGSGAVPAAAKEAVDEASSSIAGTAASLFPVNLMDIGLNSEYYPFLLTIVVPLVVVNIVNDLACIEQARASGDLFNGSTALLLDAVMTLLGAVVFGNPFPTCVYVGHSSFKAMGATFLYSWMNAVLVACLVWGWPQILVTVAEAVPQVATVGILVWIGSVVTTDAFKNKKHGVAVSVALVPALAAWKSNGVPISSPLYNPGLAVLGEGYMLVSMILGAVVAHIIDRRFMEASAWLFFASVLSFLGWIHHSRGGELAEGYFIAAIIAAIWAYAQWKGGEREADLDDDFQGRLQQRPRKTSSPVPHMVSSGQSTINDAENDPVAFKLKPSPPYGTL